MNEPPRTPSGKSTSGFEVMAVASFVVSLIAAGTTVVLLPADPWVRAVLAISTLYLVTSTITLSKVVRDRQENAAVINRVDQARLEKMLAQYDPYKVTS